MIAGLKPYKQMRDSGVEWLGQVPGHWEVVPARRRYEIRLGKMLQNAAKADDQVEVPYLKAQHVQWDGIRAADLPMMWASPRELEVFGVRNGDLLVCEGGEVGRASLAYDLPRRTIIQNALHRVRGLKGNLPGYLRFVLSAAAGREWLAAITNKATIAHFTSDKFGALMVPAPPVDEQAAIVRFLDHVDRRIQRSIAAKQGMVRLLEEQKGAIVHQAVTRGLNPDAPTKISGVDWLGEVPAHWAVDRLKHSFREVDQRSTTGEEELLSVSHKTGVTARSEKNISMFKAESNIGHKICEVNDFCANTMWLWMGAVGIAKRRGVISPAYAVYRLRGENDFNPDYVDLFIRLAPLVDEYLRRSKGITKSRLRLYPEGFLDIRVARPPLEEQASILAHVAEATGDIDQAVAVTRSEIDLLREYRARLVADVVTGKMDIRDAAAKLSHPEVAVVELSDDEDFEPEDGEFDGAKAEEELA